PVALLNEFASRLVEPLSPRPLAVHPPRPDPAAGERGDQQHAEADDQLGRPVPERGKQGVWERRKRHLDTTVARPRVQHLDGVRLSQMRGEFKRGADGHAAVDCGENLYDANKKSIRLSGRAIQSTAVFIKRPARYVCRSAPEER